MELLLSRFHLNGHTLGFHLLKTSLDNDVDKEAIESGGDSSSF